MENNLIVLFILNMFDLITTYVGIKKGVIEEANILMNSIYETTEIGFILVKLVVVVLSLIILTVINKKIESNIIKKMVNIATLVYLVIGGMHISNIYMVY